MTLQGDQLSDQGLARQEENVNPRTQVRLPLGGALVDFHVTPDDNPAPVADSRQPVFIGRAFCRFPASVSSAGVCTVYPRRTSRRQTAQIPLFSSVAQSGNNDLACAVPVAVN